MTYYFRIRRWPRIYDGIQHSGLVIWEEKVSGSCICQYGNFVRNICLSLYFPTSDRLVWLARIVPYIQRFYVEYVRRSISVATMPAKRHHLHREDSKEQIWYKSVSNTSLQRIHCSKFCVWYIWFVDLYNFFNNLKSSYIISLQHYVKKTALYAVNFITSFFGVT